MANELFFVLHGWGGNKPTHWQEILVAKLLAAGKTVLYPKMPDPTAPNLSAWLACIKETIAQIPVGSKVTVLTHSLGAISWMHLAAANGANGAQLADRVLLVAPPYLMPQAPPPDAPPGVEGFFPPPFDPAALKNAARETTLVASDTDDFATYDQSLGYAAKLDVTIYPLKGAGHISPYYGYGEWPWVFDWCVGNAELPPVPRDAV